MPKLVWNSVKYEEKIWHKLNEMQIHVPAEFEHPVSPCWAHPYIMSSKNVIF